MKVPNAATSSPERIARRSGSNFLVSFAATDPARRRGLTAIYAFCRVVDDAADDNDDSAEGRAELAFWSHDLDRAASGVPETPVGLALQETTRRFDVDVQHLRNVVAGVEWDLDGTPVETAADLERYCFLVACSVGLACLPVFGATGAAAERYAVELGHALQLTNILRDLRGDAEAGRCYVPREILALHAVEREWLGGTGPDAAYRTGGPVEGVARWLAVEARQRYAAADRALPPAQRRAVLPAQVMGAVYGELLERLEPLGAEVCRAARRVRVPRWRKLLIARRARRSALAHQ